LTGTIPPNFQRKIAPINNGAGSRLLQRAGQIFRPRQPGALRAVPASGLSFGGGFKISFAAFGQMMQQGFLK
jgi:hypothetical protein